VPEYVRRYLTQKPRHIHINRGTAGARAAIAPSLFQVGGQATCADALHYIILKFKVKKCSAF